MRILSISLRARLAAEPDATCEGEIMHIPDGFIDAPTSAAFGAVAVAGVAYAVKRAGHENLDRLTPLAGLVSAFVFAAQMLNFPVAMGTSGHLLGGMLAAVLVGPWLGAIGLAVVLGVQSLFADGGLTALGLNITNMALVGAVGGYGLFAVLRRVLPRRASSVVVASAVAAFLTVPLAAGMFVVEFALGGTVDLPLGGVAGAMIGVHLLIGIGEAAITAATISLVMSTRPDLVYGGRDLRQVSALAVRRPAPAAAPPAPPAPAGSVPAVAAVGAGAVGQATRRADAGSHS
ncbi:cobalt/nickel transport system permease protein [Frankia sp. EI5c]|uniref:energy-coupling factor ABC transporter permease n=1 Tax=Frankia sp. EI5c TaxID=683316 RepID=UPI0007C32734|nr:energy-coupling factor ABC transporter permease [Frankia sp. EI5c]OAA19027.1 cobalt/nickel transport system permease protein [Frankia sp. EI5c]OAA28031.1 cobalt/nickel transport system permease protein [Frankia sp. EI5c]